MSQNKQPQPQQQQQQQGVGQGIVPPAQQAVQNVVNGVLQNNNNNAVHQNPQQQQQQQLLQQLNQINGQNFPQKDSVIPNDQVKLLNLNLKCYEHNKEAIVGVCFANNCDYQSRLLCLQCIFSSHAEHVKYSVQIKDIDESEKNGVLMDNWPTQQICQDIRKFIKKSQQGSYNNLDSKIELLKQQAANKFLEVQNIIKERTKNVNLSKETEINKINKQTSNMFKLNGLRHNLKDYSEKKINNNELNAKIKEFAQEKPSEEDLHLLTNTFMQIKQNQELIFLPNEFDRLSKEILSLISSIPTQVLLANTINFTAAPYKDSAEYFKVSDKGTLLSFEKDSPSSYTACISDNLRKNSLYEIDIKLEGDFANNRIRFSLVKDEFIDELPQNLYYCIVRGSNDMQGEFQMLGQEWLHIKNLKNNIKIRICIGQNLFQMQSSDERGGVKLMNYKFNCANNSNWKLMIINSGKPIKIYKMACSVDHS